MNAPNGGDDSPEAVKMKSKVWQIKSEPKDAQRPKSTYFATKDTSIKRENLLAYLCLAGICLIWGTTFLAIRIGVKDFPPFLFAAIRQLSAGVLLSAIIILLQKPKLPTLKHIGQMAILGFLMITMGNGFVSWAEVFVDSGIAAIICSIMPALVILFNVMINRSETPNTSIVVGVITGLAGIVLVFSEHLQNFANKNYTVGIILIFLAIVGWSAGSIFAKKSNQNGNLFLNAGMQMFFGGVWCLPLSFFFDDHSGIHWTSATAYSLIYLVIFGSSVAYALYFYVITKLPMTIASLYSYVNPLVAVVLGSLILGEKLNLKIGLAFVVTVAGIYMVNRGYQQRVRKSELEKAAA